MQGLKKDLTFDCMMTINSFQRLDFGKLPTIVGPI